MILGRPAKVVACDASRILSAFSASESCSDDACWCHERAGPVGSASPRACGALGLA